jgi:tRNA pseudouridine38-40 synthase
MTRYLTVLAYDGTHFLGSQRQVSARTVQGELETALCKIGWVAKSVLLAGRTDTGTHAYGQVAVFDLNWNHSLDRLQRALNGYLPYDLVVREVKIASERFHPRFDASSRRYRYRLFCDHVRNPLRERYAWRVWPPVNDLEPLANIWPGTHDFSSYGSSPRKEGSTIRKVLSAEWRNCDDEWTFDIQADAFLYRMVRRLVYAQVAVGQGRITKETLLRTLKKEFNTARGENQKAGAQIPAVLAPARGLTLVEVCYENLV